MLSKTLGQEGTTLTRPPHAGVNGFQETQWGYLLMAVELEALVVRRSALNAQSLVRELLGGLDLQASSGHGSSLCPLAPFDLVCGCETDSCHMPH